VTTKAETNDFSLVLGGPLQQLFLRSGLARPPLDLLRRRVLALPLLIVAEVVVHHRLAPAVRLFVLRGIVRPGLML
jgi:hypothetical protein